MATIAKKSTLTVVEEFKPNFSLKTLARRHAIAKRNKRIVAEAKSGEPYAEIAGKHGICVSRVSQIVREAAPNFKPKTRGHANKAAIIADAATMTTKEIAAKHGLSIDYVQTIRRLAGIAATPGKAPKPLHQRRKFKPARGEMTKRIVALAPTHTCRQIAEIIGGIGHKYVRNTLRRRGLKAVRSDFSAVPKQLRKWVSTPPSVPEIAAAAVATAFSTEALPDQLPPLRSRPYPSAAEVVATALGVQLAKPAPVDTDYSIAALRKAFPEFELPTTEHVGDFSLISRPAPVVAPVDVFVKPSAAYVAEVVAHHGLDAAHERWPFLPYDELCELNRQGRAVISPPADEPLQPLGVRIWRAIKRAFGRS